ncbi:hypothetical protein [Arthrobacter woluwensis]|uniref:hypothetical protein n=1 Tax=Arthrobacter woluwensis TaxID=156980 RepID=UPI00380BCF32
MKAKAIDRAVERRLAPEVIEEIKAAPPGQAKQLGIDHGLLTDPAAEKLAAGNRDYFKPGNTPTWVRKENPAPAPITQGPRHRNDPGGGEYQTGRAAGGRHAVDDAVNNTILQVHRRGDHPARAVAGLSGDVRRSVNELMGLQGKHAQEKRLLDQDIGELSDFMDGVNDTRRVILADGTVGFFKSFEGLDKSCADAYGHEDQLQPIHEAAGWQLAKNLGPEFQGMVPTCVVREVDGKVGSLAIFAPGVQGHFARSTPPAAAVEKAAFFDALIGQQDRHRGNYLYHQGEKRLSLIDHGFTFALKASRCNQSVFTRRRRHGGKMALKAYEKRDLKRLLASEDLWGLEKILEPERATALRERAKRMLDSGKILDEGEY